MNINKTLSVLGLLGGLMLSGPVLAETALGKHVERSGDRIERHLDSKGDRINRRLDRRAEHAAANGHPQRAARLDRVGNRIDRRLDRKGRHIDRRTDRYADRH